MISYFHVALPARKYNPDAASLAADLRGAMGPIEPVLQRVDPILKEAIRLTDEELRQLVEFVRDGLLDPRARPEKLRKLIPETVPSGRPVLVFEGQ